MRVLSFPNTQLLHNNFPLPTIVNGDYTVKSYDASIFTDVNVRVFDETWLNITQFIYFFSTLTSSAYRENVINDTLKVPVVISNKY